jgi:hypothetical protein
LAFRLVETTLPAGIEIDIDEAVLLQAGGFECVGLGDHVRLGQEVALDRLLAEAAPAKIRFLAGVIDLSACAGQESDNGCNYSEKGEIPGSHNHVLHSDTWQFGVATSADGPHYLAQDTVHVHGKKM